MKKLFSVLLLILLLCSMLITVANAGTALIGDDYPYKNACSGRHLRSKGADHNDVSPYNFFYRQCTDFVAWRLNSVNKISFTNSYGGKGTWGDAKNWDDQARKLGIPVNNIPAPGAVCQKNSGKTGHVRWVAAVEGTKVTVEEYNNRETSNPEGLPSVYGCKQEEELSDLLKQGYQFIHICDLDEEAPKISKVDEITDADITGFTVSFTATDNIGISKVGAYVWGCTNPLNSKAEIEKKENLILGSYDATTQTATVRVTIGTGENQLRYYAESYYIVLYAEDFAGNYVCNPEENTGQSKPYPVSIININEKDAGKYKANKDTVSYAAPAREIFGVPQKSKDIRKAAEVDILGSYYNKAEKKTYLCVDLGSNYAHSFVDVEDFDLKTATSSPLDRYLFILGGQKVYAADGTGRLVGGTSYYGKHTIELPGGDPGTDEPDEPQVYLTDYGQCGEEVYWDFYSDGTLVIYGNGKMDDFYDVPWKDYSNSICCVIIEYGVTNIGARAFSHCGNLTSVTIPGSVKYINSYAFSDCEALASIMMPDSVQFVGGYAFFRCTSLTSVTLSENLICLGGGYREGCNGQYDENWVNYVNDEYVKVFCDCTALQSITIPKSIRFAYNAFYNCAALQDVTIEDGLTAVPSSIFAHCTGLEQISIPDSVTVIGTNAFGSATNLKSVHLGSAVTNISYAFSGCTSLTEINLPLGLTDMVEAFYNCTALPHITIPQTVCNASQAFYQCGALTDATLEQGMKVIPADLFNYCTGLEQITIPNSVKYIGQRAFSDCKALTSITMPDSVQFVGGYAFFRCTSLTSVTLSENLICLGGGYREGCNGQYDENWVNYVNDEYVKVFCDCTALQSITIPKSIRFAYNAFRNCSALTDIYYTGSQAQWETIGVGQDAIPDGVTIHYNYVPTVECDLNGDGATNAADLVTLARHIAKIERITDANKRKLADVNGDTVVNAADLTALTKVIQKNKT